MALAQRFRDSSERLISRYGTTRTYHKITGKHYDVVTQTMVSSEGLYEIKIFKTEPKDRETKYPNLVNKESAVMMIAAKSIPFKPSVGDLITETYFEETNTFSVEVVKENWSGDSVVSWRLVCSKS